jgi:cysteine synthase A
VRRLAREEGILVGQSSAASNLAAKRVARGLVDMRADASRTASCPGPDNETNVLGDGASENSRHTDIPEDCPLVVTVFWDSGERYVSTGLFDRGD